MVRVDGREFQVNIVSRYSFIVINAMSALPLFKSLVHLPRQMAIPAPPPDGRSVPWRWLTHRQFLFFPPLVQVSFNTIRSPRLA